MDSKGSEKNSTGLIPQSLGAAAPDIHINMLRGLREFYESGENEDEENEDDLMIQLSNMTYNNTGDDD